MEETLKIMLDKKLPITDINSSISLFVHSADDYPDKLKVTFIILNLIKEATGLLHSISLNDFNSQVKEKVNEIDSQAKSLVELYNMHLQQNKDIASLLTDGDDNGMVDLQHKIEELLKAYDGVLKKLVEYRDRLPIEKQIEQESKK